MSISEAPSPEAELAVAAPAIEENVPLAGRTTFGVGGPARCFAGCSDTEELRQALRWAAARNLPVLVLGGGSNLLVSEAGFPGLALQSTARDLEVAAAEGEVHLAAAAGVPWDAVVAAAIEAGGAGLEALSGIPGHAGAAPIQNIGAYGQEVAERLDRVAVLDRETLEEKILPAGECGFAYRTSHFKTRWAGRFVVTRLFFRLPRRSETTAAYAELRRHLEIGPDERVALGRLRQAVLELRRGKSMLADPADENGRSAGSFFLNPVVPAEQADEVARRYERRGGRRELARWPAPDGVKLSAAWLIEEAGFARGYGAGRAGLSTRHTLAIVNRGGASAADVIALAREIRAGVLAAFGVILQPEPILVGFGPAEEL